ncbi:hypothetical protein ACSQ67_010864 [Phaseolus vulgaris]
MQLPNLAVLPSHAFCEFPSLPPPSFFRSPDNFSVELTVTGELSNSVFPLYASVPLQIPSSSKKLFIHLTTPSDIASSTV